MRKEIFNMTQKEMTRLRVINQTIDKVITIREAAELLDLSERQVIRLKKGVLKEGPAFIVEPENPSLPSGLLTLLSTSTISCASRNVAPSSKALPSHTRGNIINWSRTAKKSLLCPKLNLPSYSALKLA